MSLRNSLRYWSIEGVGGLLFLVSVGHVVYAESIQFVDAAGLMLPVLAGVTVVVYGRWLDDHEVSAFDAPQRSLVALGQVCGGLLLGGIAGWILLIVSLESGFPDEIVPVILNGAAIGLVGSGMLVSVYVRLRER